MEASKGENGMDILHLEKLDPREVMIDPDWETREEDEE